MGLDVEWDLPEGVASVPQIRALEKKYRICAGSINPNLFQAQEYKYGSICNPDAEVRHKALTHLLDCVEIARQLGSQDISPWVSDGSNYPGTQNIRQRIGWMEEGLQPSMRPCSQDQRMLMEYKPFEPAFYHTDIADWGMALELARGRDRRRKCWWIPGIITRRRISSRLWPGCCIWKCWAASTSMTAGMPMTI